MYRLTKHQATTILEPKKEGDGPVRPICPQFDRCDRCGPSVAAVVVFHGQANLLEVGLCGHHVRVHKDRLAELDVVIVRMNPDALMDALFSHRATPASSEGGRSL